MRAICFYFQVHQPYRIKDYRFFDIGTDHHYWDDYANRSIMRKVAQKCYLPTNKLLLELIQKHEGKVKFAFSLSGVFISQCEEYAPDVLHSFQELAKTGCVEFLSETYSHALSALKSKEEFHRQVDTHRKMIQHYFGQTPTVFRNTELIYNDAIGEMVAEMGYKAQITEGAKHILGWRSPNYAYCNARNPNLKLLLKNFKLSDDMAFRFSQRSWGDWPLTTEKFVGWLNEVPQEEEVINLFMDYETFGEHQWEETGIFEFMRHLPDRVFSHSNYSFVTPSEAADAMQPVDRMHVPHTISWADEERDLSAWLGNDIQDDAFDSLYTLEAMVQACQHDPIMQRDWKYLQTSDHFYYMCTKHWADGDVHKYFSPYESPYEAFMNFMNAFSDFKLRVETAFAALPKEEHKPGEKPKRATKKKTEA